MQYCFLFTSELLERTVHICRQMILFLTLFWCVFLISLIVGSVHQFISSQAIVKRIHFQNPYYPWEDGVGKDE